MLRFCHCRGSSALTLYSSRVSKYALNLLRCMESVRDLDMYCLPVFPRYQWLHGDSAGVSIVVSIGGRFTMLRIIADLFYIGT